MSPQADGAPPADGFSVARALREVMTRAPTRPTPSNCHFTESTVRYLIPPLLYALPVTVTSSSILLITESGSGLSFFAGNRMYILSVPFSTNATGIPFLAQPVAHCLWAAPCAPAV